MFEAYERSGLFAPFIDDSELVALIEEEKSEDVSSSSKSRATAPSAAPLSWLGGAQGGERPELSSEWREMECEDDRLLSGVGPSRSFDSRDGSLAGELLGGGGIPKSTSQDWSEAQRISPSQSREWLAGPTAAPGQLEDLLSILASQVAPPEEATGQASQARRRRQDEESLGEDEESESEGSESCSEEEESVGSRGRRGAKRKRRRRDDAREAVSAEAKAELTRQRNREHARSTRRRKKQYVEQLKKQVAELLAKQQLYDSMASSRAPPEDADAREALVAAFLSLRLERGADRERWRAVVDEQVRTTLPRTPYRAEPGSSERLAAPPGTRRLKGIDALVRDALSVAEMLDMMRRRARALGGSRRVELSVETREAFLVGDRLVAEWTVATSGLADAGLDELAVDGFVKCLFHKNKLRDVELVFDAFAVADHLAANNLIDLSLVAADAVVNGVVVNADVARPPVVPARRPDEAALAPPDHHHRRDLPADALPDLAFQPHLAVPPAPTPGFLPPHNFWTPLRHPNPAAFFAAQPAHLAHLHAARHIHLVQQLNKQPPPLLPPSGPAASPRLDPRAAAAVV